MTEWVARFKRHVRSPPRLWGLHNYGDANSFGSGGTRALLAVTGRGKVWFTETGGLVLRREYRGKRVTGEFGYGLRHAARATLHALALARLSGRIERVYLYHWRAPNPVTDWNCASSALSANRVPHTECCCDGSQTARLRQTVARARVSHCT